MHRACRLSISPYSRYPRVRVWSSRAHTPVFTNTHTRIPPVSAPLAFLSLFARQFRTHTPRPALYYTTTTTAPTLYTTIFYDFVKSMKNVDGFPPSLWTLVPPPPPLVRRVFVGGMEGGRNVPRSFLRFWYSRVGSKIYIFFLKSIIISSVN